MDEHQPLRDQCLSARAHVKAGLRKSSETRTHCHGILATVSVSQVTGLTSLPVGWVCTQCPKQHGAGAWACHECAYRPSGARRESYLCVISLACIVCVCVFRQQTVGTYEESEPCAHAVSLTVRSAKENTANWCHLVGLLGTRGLSMVPWHIGVVKINTVTLFGKQRHWTIYYWIYFSLSVTLKVQASHGGKTVETTSRERTEKKRKSSQNNSFNHPGNLSLFYPHKATLLENKFKSQLRQKKKTTEHYHDEK